MVSSTPRPHFTTGKDSVPILQEAGWATGPVWTCGKSRPHRDSIPERPARSSVAIPPELPGPHLKLLICHNIIYIYIYIPLYTGNCRQYSVVMRHSKIANALIGIETSTFPHTNVCAIRRITNCMKLSFKTFRV